MADSYKTRTWKGRQQAYIQNPSTGKYGWYNIEEKYMTDYGRSVQAQITSFDEDVNYYVGDSNFNYKWDADTKEARLRRNIMYVLDTKIGEQHSVIKDVDLLHDRIREELDAMSDFEIINFAREHKDDIQLFFDYRTELTTGDYSELDAQTLKLLDALDISVDSYVYILDVPSEVRNKLSMINDYLDLKKELRDMHND